jgi:V-type H+-transporting ATPase subunit d
MFGDILFNVDHGYLEGLVRGFKSGILRAQDYSNLVQCETLDGKKYKHNLYIISCINLC